MKKNYLLLFVIFFLLSCSEKQKDSLQTFEIKSCIITYNNLLAEGYNTLNMQFLRTAATERRVLKAYHHMSALGEGRVKMQAELKKIIFGEISIPSSNKAEIQTEEKWIYEYINIDTGKEVFSNVVDYKLTYFLVMEKNKWFVDEIKIHEEIAEKEALKEVPFLKRPMWDSHPGAPKE